MQHTAPKISRAGRDYMLLAAAFVAMYLPVYADLYGIFWKEGGASHGPVILAFIAWLFWRKRAQFALSNVERLSGAGGALVATGVLLYLIGRSQSIYQLQVVSQIPLLLGIVQILLGRSGLQEHWFPILLLGFLVPVPGSILDQFLMPLKNCVSFIVDGALHMAGLPIARAGVVLIIGPYNLLIADACSGLNSIVALTGIGLLYVYVAGHTSRWHNALLLASVLPIAFAANVVRVAALVLITYYGGESAGNYFHDHAGVLEIAVAFGGFFLFDLALRRGRRRTAVAGLPVALLGLSA